MKANLGVVVLLVSLETIATVINSYMALLWPMMTLEEFILSITIKKKVVVNKVCHLIL